LLQIFLVTQRGVFIHSFAFILMFDWHYCWATQLLFAKFSLILHSYTNQH
jgi:hypothetical protein